MPTSQLYHCPLALLPDGWAENVVLEVNDGQLTSLARGQAPGDAIQLTGPVLPGMPNLHSHAFQYAMAGLAEVHRNPNDSFWSWRELMYQLVGRLNPDDVRIIASQLYIDMLRAGYTQVAEFHYLFHDHNGAAYQDPGEMGGQILSAAEHAGIGVTLLPALYSHSGFNGQPPNAGQQRFVNSVDDYLTQQVGLSKRIGNSRLHKLGSCFHSLRAVRPEQINEVLESTEQSLVHLHIAEQQREVDECLNWSGQRPVEWLFNNVAVDRQWCLIHATHLNKRETRTLANSGAVAGLCPSTEANLGDGIFPGVTYNRANGNWGIGSDSHVSLSVAGELRLLEYSQRLRDQQRNRLHDTEHPNVADHLFHRALAGGNQACGVELGLASGNRADFLVLDGAHPFIAPSASEYLLNRWVFALNDNVIRDVFVAGEAIIENYRHPQQAATADEFTQLLTRLRATL